jgi:ABC-2 type transport system ATP-binding protein
MGRRSPENPRVASDIGRANNEAITAVDLTKKFGDFTAVDGISFTVKRGEIFGFLGPNGAGKTTTMRMLMGLLPPTSGEVTVLGLDSRTQKNEIHQRIGYMSQRFTLYNDLTVAENLNFFGRAYGVRGEKLEERRAAILEMAGLRGREKELTRNLSGGWRQRLALGCAILHEPELLFLDEPTAGVDPISRRDFWDLLYTLANEGTIRAEGALRAAGSTIFVTTHYMDEAEHCHRLVFIQNGRLSAMGSPEAIKKEKMDGQVLEIDCSNVTAAVAVLRETGLFKEVALYGAQIHVVIDNALARQEKASLMIKELLAAEDITVEGVAVIEPSLEDVFIASVRNEAGQPSVVVRSI